MKINKSSWHCRLMDKLYGDSLKSYAELYGNNFCEYFWRLMLAIGLLSLITFLALAAIVCLLVCFYQAPIIIPILAGLVLLAYIIGYIIGLIQDRRFKTPEIVYLVTAQVKAIKDKYCPLIEWVDK